MTMEACSSLRCHIMANLKYRYLLSLLLGGISLNTCASIVLAGGHVVRTDVVRPMVLSRYIRLLPFWVLTRARCPILDIGKVRSELMGLLR